MDKYRARQWCCSFGAYWVRSPPGWPGSPYYIYGLSSHPYAGNGPYEELLAYYGLDPQGIIEIRELILRLNRKHQITFLISSHILDELSRLATHYGFIDNGQLVKEISREELDAICGKCLRLEVTNVQNLALVLDRMKIDYNIISEQTADIFIQERDESLESYYVSLIGGAKYE